MSADPVTGIVGSRPAAGVQRHSLSAQVVDHIRTRIFDGTLVAGQRVPQEAIAIELGVSRVPVREALIALEENGLVTSEPHRGVHVLPIRQDDIEDHYRMYGMIQGLAAVRAVDHVTEPVLARLQQLHDEMAAGSGDGHLLNAEFHALINRTGASKRIRAVLKYLSRNIAQDLFQIPPPADEAASIDHREIIAALMKADTTALQELNHRHLRREGDIVVGELRRRGVLSE
ncbi:GntR family transcriptional regulator [Pseudonocardia dioxanivorans]|uniref:GntR family transcriptional regulator n=1 Tax=Pseudonocardia dioxanivorans TaxID=240495 RepID=UPI000CD24301|nr:GntR family transcriptional regulator [Pseudonocardia dioxanivorans]